MKDNVINPTIADKSILFISSVKSLAERISDRTAIKVKMISRIWTIGHSTRRINVFISLLDENRIKLLADVRSWPGSKRYPQFNKEVLGKSLREHAIRYEHFPELGGRRKPKKDSRNTAWRNDAFRGYADYMETREFVAGIARLEEGTQREGAAAIMCAEAVWWKCHRSLIADYLTPNDH